MAEEARGPFRLTIACVYREKREDDRGDGIHDA
jgi:hypothetical protein